MRIGRINLAFIVLSVLLFTPDALFGQERTVPAPLEVGYSTSISKVTLAKMQYAKSVGISCIQIGVGHWVDRKKCTFVLSDNEITKEVARVKKITDAVGIKVWAIHMPFGRGIDLSLLDEAKRKKVIALQKKVLTFCRVFQPKIILFHPSWYLSLDARKEHVNQLVKSVMELKDAVRNIGATMVIENMTGPKLYVKSGGVRYERPLCRTVEETMKIMNRLPEGIYAAVDMNHILHPEKLILALGDRLKFVHIADGDGAHERHYFPCSGKGMNDWTAILDALYKANYTGPFMYECHYKDVKDLTVCYALMYNRYIMKKYVRSGYSK